MKQHLRSLWTLLLLMMWCSVGLAQTTVTFDATKDKGTSTSTTLTKNGVTLKFGDGKLDDGVAYRWYAKSPQTLTISSTETITKIEFTCTANNTSSNGPGKISKPSTGKYTYIRKIGTWTGETNSVVFSNTAQVRMTKIVVTLASSKTPTTLTFGFTNKTANINEPFTATATLKANDADLAGDITYESSNTTCATVDKNTGVVTPLTVGQTTITAKYAGTEEYSKSDAFYILNVIDPSDTRIIFDQNNEDHPAFENLKGSYDGNPGTVDFIDIHGNNYAFTINEGACKQNSCQIKKGETISSPIFNLANGYTVRVYYTTSATSNTLLLSVAEDKVYGVKYDDQSWVATLSTTKDEAFSMKAVSSFCKVTKIEITPAVVLDENATKEETSKFLEKNINKTIDIVTLTRTLVANKWNTFCVPFETELAGTALEGATVKAVGTIEGNVINLVDATKIEAGVPYLVMPTTESIVNPTFKGVTISVTTPVEKGNADYKFVGTYSPKTISDKEFGKIWGVTADGKLAKINANTTMKGLRAYFVFPTNAAAAKLNFDDETTGINNIETNATVNGKVYNLNGQYVGNSLNGLKKGIYVVNGKKVIK